MKFATIHIKKGDTVKVIAGREKGKSGKVLAVMPKKETVLIEKINFVKRHRKPSQQFKQGGIMEKESPLHWSNVMLMCVKCNKPVRVKNKVIDGKNNRTCIKCGDLLEASK